MLIEDGGIGNQILGNLNESRLFKNVTSKGRLVISCMFDLMLMMQIWKTLSRNCR